MDKTRKNITVTFSIETEKQMQELMGYYQKTSITRITKTDVMRHLINKDHEEKFGGKES